MSTPEGVDFPSVTRRIITILHKVIETYKEGKAGKVLGTLQVLNEY